MGRAIDASGVDPIKSRLVRPILRIDLPFLDGVSLHEFGKITTEEFASYNAFRDHLRATLLDLDDAVDDVHSDLELVKIGLKITDEVRSVKAELGKVGRTRAVAATGAALGSVTAVLAAVYGPALKEAIEIVGTSGGVWGILQAAAENNTRSLRENKWYYVWALSQESNKHVYRF
jgi:hypothetical protein